MDDLFAAQAEPSGAATCAACCTTFKAKTQDLAEKKARGEHGCEKRREFRAFARKTFLALDWSVGPLG